MTVKIKEHRDSTGRHNQLTDTFFAASKTIFSEKSLSVLCFVRHVLSHPVPSPKRVTETENITKQSCLISFKGKIDTFKVKLPPLQCCPRQS